ncbi:MAG TPA: S8 family serine peptidase, partial [Chloroflexota bacterium]
MQRRTPPVRLSQLSRLALIATFVFPASAAAAPAPDRVPDQYVVVLADSVTDPAAAASDLASRHSLTVGHRYEHSLKGLSARVPPERLAALAADPRVRFVAADRLLQFDQVVASGQSLPTGVDRIEADRSRTRAGNGRGSVDADVAVIDTGIDPTHPDLNVVGGHNCTSKDPDAWQDDAGHGTHVAGVIGARDNSIGVVGVAPGARLWAVKVGDAKGAKISDVVCGLEWVAQNSATIKLANMSLSSPGADDGRCGAVAKDALHAAVCAAAAAGVTQVASAGNSATDLAGTVPAAYPEVLTVTAMADLDGRPGGLASGGCRAGERDDGAASFSNFAVGERSAAHTIAAPGVCIRTTFLVGRGDGGGDYITASGTSAAAPHVTGTAALCLASRACAGLTPDRVIAALRAAAAARPASYGFDGDPTRPAAG